MASQGKLSDQPNPPIPAPPCYVLILYGQYTTSSSEHKNSQGLYTNKLKLEYIPPEYTSLEELNKEFDALVDKKIFGFSGGKSDHWLGKLIKEHYEKQGAGRHAESLYLYNLKLGRKNSEPLPSENWEAEDQQQNEDRDFSDEERCINNAKNKQTCFQKLVDRGKQLKERNEINDVKKWKLEDIHLMDQDNNSNITTIASATSGSVSAVALITLISFFLKKKLS